MTDMETEDYRMAIAGEGPQADAWSDKPHRLVYDLCAEVERLQRELMYLNWALEDAEAKQQFVQFSTLCTRGGGHVDFEGCCHGKGPGLYVEKGATPEETTERVRFLQSEFYRVWQK